ncbi:MAG: KamA family radical SAM protein [Deltaproteobacteria bacterium]|nr:KamA family radical SAM protein [Deltaproteobacteria bacterium]
MPPFVSRGLEIVRDPADSPRWDDWRWQASSALRSLAELDAALRLSDDERAGATRAEAEGFPIAITPHTLSLIDREDPSCPIRRQFVPSAAEAIEVPGDLRDPLGEEANEVAPNLVCRYPDRALLLATDRCAVYCRFCTRSRMVGDGGGPRSLAKLEEAFQWLERNRQVREVIVSGGDPLVMGTGRIRRLLERLGAMDWLDTVRIATRAPVTIPQRIDAELCRVLRESHPSVWVMTHFNHPKELSEASHRACAMLVDHGLPVMNQSVLLRGVNDDPDTLEALFRGLVRWRVRPYYLLQADVVRGTGHLRTPISTGIHIMERLQGRLSGIALPKLICDTPNGRGKVPIGPATIVASEGGRHTLKTFRGEEVDYLDPPSPDPEDPAPA